MKIQIKTDIAKFESLMKSIKLDSVKMLAIEKVPATYIINNQKLLVQKDTHATEKSIQSHYVRVNNVIVEDDIGPETDYAPYIEFGTTNPNYPIQPFIRPAVKDIKAIEHEIATGFKATIESGKVK